MPPPPPLIFPHKKIHNKALFLLEEGDRKRASKILRALFFYPFIKY